MTKEKKSYILMIQNVCMFLLGILLCCIPGNLSYAEEMSGMTVTECIQFDEVTQKYWHTPQKELTAQCSLFDEKSIYLCYHQYTEDGYLIEYPMKAENLIITKDGEPAGSAVYFENSKVHPKDVSFRFKEPGDYEISSSIEGHDDSFVTIHVPEPTTGFFTEPECSNRNRYYFYPYENNNVIYFMIPPNTRLNTSEDCNGGYPETVFSESDTKAYGEVAREEIEQYFTYELVSDKTNVYKLTLNTGILNEVNCYDIQFYYESIDGTFEGTKSETLRVGFPISDKIGLTFSTYSAPDDEWIQKEITLYKSLIETTILPNLVYYDYNEQNELVETIPDMDDIKIMKNGTDITEQIWIYVDSIQNYVMQFEEIGEYQLLVTLDDGREDMVSIYVDEYSDGFYDSLKFDIGHYLGEYRLTEDNNVVYYVLSDGNKLNEGNFWDNGRVFSLVVDGKTIPFEEQSEYFTYELIEETNYVYKITFRTEKEEMRQMQLVAYYETANGNSGGTHSLDVYSQIMTGLTVGHSWQDDTGNIFHTTQRNLTLECSLFRINRLWFCYHQHAKDGSLQEYELKAEELIITRDGKDAKAYVDITNYLHGWENISLRFKEPGDYIISSAVKGQEDSFVTIHVSEPTTGFFTEPVCSNRIRTYFYPYENKNVIYYILPENTKLCEYDGMNNAYPIDVYAQMGDDRIMVNRDEIQQYFSYELLKEGSRIYKFTFNVENLEKLDYCDIYIYYESTDGSFSGIYNGSLRVGGEKDDRIGLSITQGYDLSEMDGSTYEYAMRKEITTSTRMTGAASYRVTYYDYNEKNELIEIIPEEKNVRIIKDGLDVTEQMDFTLNSYGGYEMAFKETGRYRLFVKLDDGREDVVDIYVENWLYGFYNTPELDANELAEYRLTKNNNVVYYILSDKMQLNEQKDVNDGKPFAVAIDGEKVATELQSQYFTYELVENTDNVYKITFRTDKTSEERRRFDVYVYYQNTDNGQNEMDYLFVINEIPKEEPITEAVTTEETSTEERNLLYGFYESPMLNQDKITEFQLTENHNVVYYLLSDEMKINGFPEVNDGAPFSIEVNGKFISKELQSEYFVYETVEGNDKLYKITFETDKIKEECEGVKLFVYYKRSDAIFSESDSLQVTNEIISVKPTEEPSPGEKPTEETTTKEPSPGEKPTEETTTKEPSPGEKTTEEIPTEEPSPGEKATEEIPTEEPSLGGKPTEEPSPGEEPTEEIPTEEPSPGGKPTEEPSPGEEPTEEIPTEEPSPGEKATEEILTEEPSPGEEPTEEIPTEEQPSFEKPTEESMTGEKLTEDNTGAQPEIVSLDHIVMTPIEVQSYCAREIKPELILNYQGVTLLQGRDYTVEYQNNITVGTAAVTLIGIGNYSGSRVEYFQIRPYQIEGLSETLKAKDGGMYSAAYTKKKINLNTAFKLPYTLDDERYYLEPKEGVDYTFKYYNNIKIGTARIVYTFKGNYTGTVVKKFLIVPPAPVLVSVKQCGDYVQLRWKKVASCDRYEVYRATSSKGKYKKIATVTGKKNISYTDKKVQEGKKYYYKVRACKKVSGKLYKSSWSKTKVIRK